MAFRDYYELTKPGLLYGNLITVIAGFAVGTRVAHAVISLELLIATIAGISLVMASGCVINNSIDRDIDAKMQRTKDRALVTKKISVRAANVYAAILGVVGFAILALATDLAATAVAAVGWLAYVGLYSLWAKRRTVHGALIGSISGATPPVVGYAAASGRLDGGALILFLALVLWQMPHFYAIAIRRRDEYAAAKIPVLPVERGMKATKITILVYIVAFMIATSLFAVLGYAGYVYLAVMLVVGGIWFGLGFTGLFVTDDMSWARKMFLWSLVVIVVFAIMIGIGA